MSIDPSFGRPWERFSPVPSFQQPVAAPAAGPFDAPVYALPCVNHEWLRLLLGAAMQLENPSAWSESLTDAQRLAVVQQAQELRCGLAALGACVNPVIGASLDGCVLNLHLADGSTVAVTNWAADFCGCVRGCVPPPPTNPRGTTQDQLACNYAGFLAAQIIQGAIRAADVQWTIANLEWQIALAVSSYLAGFGFVMTGGFVQAAHVLWEELQAGNLAHMQLAETDPTLKSDLTCAIFSAIRADGQLTAGNFPTVLANICAIGWTYADVISTICGFVGALGFTGLAALENFGALADEDCSGCPTAWCHEIDFTVSDGGWTNLLGPGVAGTYVPGVGWQATNYLGARDYLNIISPTFPEVGHNATQCCVLVECGAWTGGGGSPRAFIVYLGGVFQGFENFPSNAAFGVPTKQCAAPTLFPTCDQLSVQWSADLGTGVTLKKVQIIGTGVNPFGANNCTF